jgi:hypothetical protein
MMSQCLDNLWVAVTEQARHLTRCPVHDLFAIRSPEINSFSFDHDIRHEARAKDKEIGVGVSIELVVGACAFHSEDIEFYDSVENRVKF